MEVQMYVLFVAVIFIGSWVPKKTNSFSQGIFRNVQKGKEKQFYIIAKHVVKSIMECGQLCFRDNDCRHFQYCSGKCSKSNCKLCKELPTSIKITRSHGTNGHWTTYELLDAKSRPCFSNRCENAGSCVIDSSKHDGYGCACPSGFEGKFCEIENGVYGSCRDAYRRNSRLKQNGVYRVQADTSSGYTRAYCHISPLKGCEGGGWTTVMKIDGNKKTFDYYSPLWSNKVSYNEDGGLTGFDYNETKLPTYWSTSFRKICIGMSVGNTTRFLTIDHSANSLYECFADEVFRCVVVKLEKWRHLIVNASLQPLCHREGFNVKADKDPRPYAKVRLGIVGNDQDHCETPDSFLGFGGQWNWAPQCHSYNVTLGALPVCGNVVKCKKNTKRDRIIKAMGYILVR